MRALLVAALAAGAVLAAYRLPPAPVPARQEPDHRFSFVDARSFGARPAHAPALTPESAVPMPMRLAALGQAAHDLRARGEGEDAVYRLRAAHLDAATIARLTEMEEAEARWRASARQSAPAQPVLVQD